MPSRTSGCALRRSTPRRRRAAAPRPRTGPASGRAPAGLGRLDHGADEQQHRGRAGDGAGRCRSAPVAGAGRASGSTRGAATSATIAIGAGRRNVQRQPISVSSPENTRPSEKPLAPQAVKMPEARLRAGPSANVVVMIERPPGAVNAAAAPLTKRVAISRVPSSTSPPSSEATVKTASATRKTRRRPSRSAVRPPSSSRPP